MPMQADDLTRLWLTLNDHHGPASQESHVKKAAAHVDLRFYLEIRLRHN